MCAARDGIGAPEVERRYGVSAKSARAMLGRVRAALRREPSLAGTVGLDAGPDVPISLAVDVGTALGALVRGDPRSS
jgi:hypothetical protein